MSHTSVHKPHREQSSKRHRQRSKFSFQRIQNIAQGFKSNNTQEIAITGFTKNNRCCAPVFFVAKQRIAQFAFNLIAICQRKSSTRMRLNAQCFKNRSLDHRIDRS